MRIYLVGAGILFMEGKKGANPFDFPFHWLPPQEPPRPTTPIRSGWRSESM